MQIRIPLLFHFNQHNSEFARTASLACYRGLLRVLRSHPNVPINIQISGTLIRALEWLDPEPLQLIWEGLRAGQFELLGSTYAQNVPYASDDWDNVRQIEMHLEVLHEIFGVTPVTFWNPERAWRQSLLPIIAGAGYRFTLVEDHILANARLAEPVVVTSQVGAHILTLLYDDHLLRHLFNFAVWLGRPAQLQHYLIRRSEHPNASNHCLTYAEDAEAMGLWGWREGIVPNQTWHRLDQVLTLLEALPEIELVHLTNAPASAGNLSPVADGIGLWMADALEDESRPYHEAGYEDYYDFNTNSPRLATYRAFFDEIREGLIATGEKVQKKGKKGEGARSLYKAALHNYLAHQYEFGCVGIGSEQYRGWRGAQASWAFLQAAEWALKPQSFVLRQDVNHDGHDEAALSDGRNLLITTPAGGRLLYWFDLTTGYQYIGNQRAVTKAPYESDAALPDLPQSAPALWLPDEFRPQAIMPEARLTAEAAPTRLGKYLPEWIWERERGPFELLTREMRLEDAYHPRPAQRRGLVDYITLNGTECDAGAWLELTIDGDDVVFHRQLPDDVSMEKRYRLHDGDVHATYRWCNRGDEEANIAWRVVSELCPRYERLLDAGRKTMQFIEDEDAPGVLNRSAKEEVRIVPDRLPDGVAFLEAMLALEVALDYALILGAGDETTISFVLQRQKVKNIGKKR